MTTRGHTPLFILHSVCVLCGSMLYDIVAITPLLRSMGGTYQGQVCFVVLGMNLVLLVLAALVIVWVLWYPGVYLVLSVLAALGICVQLLWKNSKQHKAL